MQVPRHRYPQPSPAPEVGQCGGAAGRHGGRDAEGHGDGTPAGEGARVPEHALRRPTAIGELLSVNAAPTIVR